MSDHLKSLLESVRAVTSGCDPELSDRDRFGVYWRMQVDKEANCYRVAIFRHEGGRETMVRYLTLVELISLARLAEVSPDENKNRARLNLASIDLKVPEHHHFRLEAQDTSISAAERIRRGGKLSKDQDNVLRLLHMAGEGGLTDPELEKLACANGRSTFRARRADLKNAGFVKDSGRRQTHNGTPRIVWVITETGIDRYHQRQGG
jgi:hypothetical protein